jgi:hypothetical protein
LLQNINFVVTERGGKRWRAIDAGEFADCTEMHYRFEPFPAAALASSSRPSFARGAAGSAWEILSAGLD